MDIAEAFQIVLDHARKTADARLQEACDVLEDLAVNEYGDEEVKSPLPGSELDKMAADYPALVEEAAQILAASFVRDRECLDCKHTWTSPVRMSAHTANLSGEATEFCPVCNSRSVMSHPQR